MLNTSVMMDLFVESIKDFLDTTFGEWIALELLLSILWFAGSFVLLTVIKVILNHIIHKTNLNSRVLLKSLLNWIYLIIVFVLVFVYFADFRF